MAVANVGRQRRAGGRPIAPPQCLENRPMLPDRRQGRDAVHTLPLKQDLVVLAVAAEEIANVRVVGHLDQIVVQGTVDPGPLLRACGKDVAPVDRLQPLIFQVRPGRLEGLQLQEFADADVIVQILAAERAQAPAAAGNVLQQPRPGQLVQHVAHGRRAHGEPHRGLLFTDEQRPAGQAHLGQPAADLAGVVAGRRGRGRLVLRRTAQAPGIDRQPAILAAAEIAVGDQLADRPAYRRHAHPVVPGQPVERQRRRQRPAGGDVGLEVATDVIDPRVHAGD